MAKTVAIDFDGVINSYTSGWQGAGRLPDPPNPGAFEFIESVFAAGYRVTVLSTRAETNEARNAMRRWFKNHGMGERTLQNLYITNIKGPAVIYLDDRAVRFVGKFPTVKDVLALGSNPGRAEPNPSDEPPAELSAELPPVLKSPVRAKKRSTKSYG